MVAWAALLLAWLASFLMLLGVVLQQSWYEKEEGFADMVDFMSARSAARFLSADADGYVAGMTSLDLHARRATSASEYIVKIAAACMDFTPKQRQKYKDAAREADDAMAKLGDKNSFGLPLGQISRQPWVFAITRGALYEDGMPHTRAHVIFVSSTQPINGRDLVRTLVHEKIHVYQRQHQTTVNRILERHGYTKWRRRRDVPRIRANPDLDDWVYIDPIDNHQPMMAVYSSATPSSVTDVLLNTPSFEHPYEQMAYAVSRQAVP